MKMLLLGFIIFVLFVALDLAWFQIAGNFFKAQIGTIARLSADGSWNVRILPALLVYVLMAFGVLIFVLPRVSSLGAALLTGGAFGLIGYGLYDLTNLATLTAWTIPFAVVDMTWGTILTGVVSGIAYSLSKLPFFS